MYTPLYIPTPLKPIFSSKSLFFLATPSSSFFFKRMGHLIEEKALGDDHQRGDSLEEKISLFFDEEDEELDRNSEGDWADDEAANNELHDPIERKEFWDSQEALLLVLFFLSLFPSSSSSLIIRLVWIQFSEITHEFLCVCFD